MEWINVNDGLPEEAGDYFVLYTNYMVEVRPFIKCGNENLEKVCLR